MSTVPIVPEPKVPEPVTQVPTAQVRPFKLGVPSVNVPEIFPGFQLRFGEAEFRIGQSSTRLNELLGQQSSLKREELEIEQVAALSLTAPVENPDFASVLISRNTRIKNLKEELANLQIVIEMEIDVFSSAESDYFEVIQRITALREKKMSVAADPEVVARKVLYLLERYWDKSGLPAPFYSVGKQASLLAFGKKILPDRVIDRFVRAAYKGK